jgi:hypothetical protein
MLRHDLAPGAVTAAPAGWPADSALTRRAGRATLVLWLHPECPCGRASLAEFGTLGASGAADLQIVLADVPGAGDELEQAARALPGARVQRDEGAREARRFGARTSGLVQAFDATGRRLYSGGITAARGHVGDNLARAALARWLAGGPLPPPSLPVFGCPLPSTTP